MKKFLLLFFTSASLSATPQAVIFDFDGVLTGPCNREVIVHFLCQSLQLSDQEFELANQEKRAALKEGMSDEEYWTAYAEKNAIPLPENWHAVFKLFMKEALGVNREMYNIVRELKQRKVRVGLLTNLDDRLARLTRDLKLYEAFDPCLISCELGVEKPNPKAYELLVERLQLPTEDIVLVDDKLENVESAQNAGLDAILFQSSAQLYRELETRSLVD